MQDTLTADIWNTQCMYSTVGEVVLHHLCYSFSTT